MVQVLQSVTKRRLRCVCGSYTYGMTYGRRIDFYAHVYPRLARVRTGVSDKLARESTFPLSSSIRPADATVSIRASFDWLEPPLYHSVTIYIFTAFHLAKRHSHGPHALGRYRMDGICSFHAREPKISYSIQKKTRALDISYAAAATIVHAIFGVRRPGALAVLIARGNGHGVFSQR